MKENGSRKEPRRGMRRYTKPSLLPIYGILLAYIIIWIYRLFMNVKLFEIDVFKIGQHGVTIADILIISGALLGIMGWVLKRKSQ